MDDYVTCSVCGHTYRGKVPKGGDGSVLFPRKHNRKIPDPRFIGSGNVVMKYITEVCDGSYMASLKYDESKQERIL